MSHPWRRAAVAAVLVALVALPATAHKRHRVGPLDLEIGWAHEPAFAGLPNAVEVQLTRGGEPATDANAQLSVAIVFGEGGEAVSSEPLELLPVDGEPGALEAFVIPTRPGAYTFRLTGSLDGESIDEEFTSGERSFDDVETPTDVQFPERDPTGAEVADRLERIDQRLAALAGEDDGASSTAVPTVVSIAALLVAAAALVVALLRRRQA